MRELGRLCSPAMLGTKSSPRLSAGNNCQIEQGTSLTHRGREEMGQSFIVPEGLERSGERTIAHCSGTCFPCNRSQVQSPASLTRGSQLVDGVKDLSLESCCQSEGPYPGKLDLGV